MAHRKSKPSDPMTEYGRPITYDREIFIEICRRLIIGEDLQKICTERGMPIGPMFLGWVQDHEEAREIHRSADNFHFDRRLAKHLEVCLLVSVSEWEGQVRANLERGWRADWIDRKYIPPDWSKVYRLIGGPPVGGTEMQAYNELLNAFTRMLEPRDEMELILTKEAADATWEADREAREKNGLISVAQPPNTLDHGRPLDADFKYCRARDVAQSRAIKRRDNALRQIARWRKGLGASARRLPDHLLVKHLLAQRYAVEQFVDTSAGDALEAAAPLAPTGKAAEAAPAHAPTGEVAVAAAPALTAAGEAAEPAPTLAPTGNAVEAAPLIAAAGDVAVVTAPAFATAREAAEAPPPLAPTGELQQSHLHVPLRPRLAQAAPPLAAPAAAVQDAPSVRAPSEAAKQHDHYSRSQPECAEARLDGACAVRFLAEPIKSVAVNANRRL
jgi:Bacteriophage Sf6, terminase small subunit-like